MEDFVNWCSNVVGHSFDDIAPKWFCGAFRIVRKEIHAVQARRCGTFSSASMSGTSATSRRSTAFFGPSGGLKAPSFKWV